MSEDRPRFFSQLTKRKVRAWSRFQARPIATMILRFVYVSGPRADWYLSITPGRDVIRNFLIEGLLDGQWLGSGQESLEVCC